MEILEKWRRSMKDMNFQLNWTYPNTLGRLMMTNEQHWEEKLKKMERLIKRKRKVQIEKDQIEKVYLKLEMLLKGLKLISFIFNNLPLILKLWRNSVSVWDHSIIVLNQEKKGNHKVDHLLNRDKAHLLHLDLRIWIYNSIQKIRKNFKRHWLKIRIINIFFIQSLFTVEVQKVVIIMYLSDNFLVLENGLNWMTQ